MVPVFFRFVLRIKNCLNSPPVAQQNEKIARANGAIAVDIRIAIIAVGAAPPIGQEDQQVAGPNDLVTVEVAEDRDDEREIE